MAVISRGFTRDYIDLAALFENASSATTINALKEFNRLYPSDASQPTLQTLRDLLLSPAPKDFHKI
jgi:hypothetical protein